MSKKLNYKEKRRTNTRNTVETDSNKREKYPWTEFNIIPL